MPNRPRRSKNHVRSRHLGAMPSPRPLRRPRYRSTCRTWCTAAPAGTRARNAIRQCAVTRPEAADPGARKATAAAAPRAVAVPGAAPRIAAVQLPAAMGRGTPLARTGGTASGGGGTWHATGAYEAPPTRYVITEAATTPLPPPYRVNRYSAGCYNCGGWNTGAAVAAGITGVAAGAVIGAASANAYPAGLAVKSAFFMNITPRYRSCVFSGAVRAFTSARSPVSSLLRRNATYYRVVPIMHSHSVSGGPHSRRRCWRWCPAPVPSRRPWRACRSPAPWTVREVQVASIGSGSTVGVLVVGGIGTSPFDVGGTSTRSIAPHLEILRRALARGIGIRLSPYTPADPSIGRAMPWILSSYGMPVASRIVGNGGRRRRH